uniref:UL24 n=1 Tax=Human herpesvirus 1 TaxID=10298 RepID=G8H8E5_HHV1|nr:UL24 [Human alphaherpesvirus 1]
MAARTRSLVERRRVLMAGVRSHTRFYKALAKEVREFHATKICGTLLTLLSGSLQGRSVFEATRVTLICEVDLGPRRPDCICVFEFANDKTLGGVCVIIELKTCKYISSGDTASKREQRATGMKQLRHSLKLLQSLAPPGDKIVYLCPVLVFVAQRTLRVSRVTRLVPQKVSGNITAVVRMLQSLSTYTVPMEPRTQRARRRRGGAARGSASRPKRSHSGARDPPEPAARQVPPADQTPASTEGGGVLKRIAALFCVPVATKTKPRAAYE